MSSSRSLAIVGVLVAVAGVAYLALHESNLFHRDATGPALTHNTQRVEPKLPGSEYVGGPSEGDYADVSAIDRKGERQLQNLRDKTGLSNSELDEAREAAINAFYTKQGNIEFLEQLHAQLTEEVGVEEADFRLALMATAQDWNLVRQLVTDRESELGQSGVYDSFLFQTGINTGQISATEIREFLDRGQSLPDDIVFRLVQQGGLETVRDLKDRGLVGNPNYEDPVSGTNAIGALISHASSYPGQNDIESTRAMLESLIEMGVNLKPESGAFDPLDIALRNTNSSNAAVKYALVETLISSGVSIEPSHIEFLQAIPDGPHKERLASLFANSL